ncbi:hypothetical protein MTO96_019796 [Rhipicephalus appendiculatus]
MTAWTLVMLLSSGSTNTPGAGLSKYVHEVAVEPQQALHRRLLGLGQSGLQTVHGCTSPQFVPGGLERKWRRRLRVDGAAFRWPFVPSASCSR